MSSQYFLFKCHCELDIYTQYKCTYVCELIDSYDCISGMELCSIIYGVLVFYERWESCSLIIYYTYNILINTSNLQASRETGALKEAKDKLEKQVEDLTLRNQLEKRRRVNILLAQTHHIGIKRSLSIHIWPYYTFKYIIAYI